MDPEWISNLSYLELFSGPDENKIYKTNVAYPVGQVVSDFIVQRFALVIKGNSLHHLFFRLGSTFNKTLHRFPEKAKKINK
jgi:hypothetical protein